MSIILICSRQFITPWIFIKKLYSPQMLVCGNPCLVQVIEIESRRPKNEYLVLLQLSYRQKTSCPHSVPILSCPDFCYFLSYNMTPDITRSVCTFTSGQHSHRKGQNTGRFFVRRIFPRLSTKKDKDRAPISDP